MYTDLVIKTVLKTGGEYDPGHVIRLAEQLRKHVNIPYRLVCYTDAVFTCAGIEIRPLLHDWPGWWSKLEIFRDIERSFYMDLDMTIEGDITDIVARDYDFAALNNMNPRIGGIGSAVMAWNGDKTRLYHLFKSNPAKFIAENSQRSTKFWGDQGFIFSNWPPQERFQNIFPKRIKRFDEIGQCSIKVYFGKWRPWKKA